MKKVSPDRRALTVELYNNGFTYIEVARETGYSVASIDKIIRTGVAKGEITQAKTEARVERGLRNFVQYANAQSWYTPINQYQDPVIRAFGRIKLPQITKQVVDSIAVDDLSKPADQYEALILAIVYPRINTSSQLARLYFNSFTQEPPQDITIAGLMDHLRKGVLSDLREQLRVPIYVDREGLEAALKTLTPKQEDVLRRRFFEGETLVTIGNHYHRSPENIRQAEARALRQLRRPSIFPGIKYAITERLLEYTRGLEETVAMQELKIAQRDRTISEYESRFGPLPSDEQQILLSDELALRKKLDTKIDDIEMSVRSYNCLKNANLRIIRKVVQKTERDLLHIKNFGRKSLNEIKGILASMGLHLDMASELPAHLLYE